MDISHENLLNYTAILSKYTQEDLNFKLKDWTKAQKYTGTDLIYENLVESNEQIINWKQFAMYFLDEITKACSIVVP